MTFVALIWLAAGTVLIPAAFKPSPITYWGKASPAATPIPVKMSGYDPSLVPSDSLWAAQCDSVRAHRAEQGDSLSAERRPVGSP